MRVKTDYIFDLKCFFSKAILLSILFLFSFKNVFAASEVNYHGRILKSDDTPVTGSVDFILEVRSSGVENCLLYSETQTKTVTDGIFSLTLGTGSRTDSTGYTFEAVFANRGTFSLPTQCTAPAISWTPASTAGRKLFVSFKDSTMMSFEAMPSQALNMVPQAIDSQTLGGYASGDFLKILNSGSVSLTQSNLQAAFTGTAYTNLQAIMSGNFVGMTSGAGASLPSVAANPSTPAVGSIWYNSSDNTLKYYDGAVRTISSASYALTGVTSTADVTLNGSASGSITSGSVAIGLADTGVSAGSYAKVTVDTKGRVTAGSTLVESDIPVLSTPGKVSGSAIVGPINTSGAIATSSSVTAASMSTRTFDLYDSDNTNRIRFLTPATGVLTSDYQLVFPSSAGSANQVLATDGSGNLSWVASSSGSVTTVGSFSGTSTANGMSVSGNSIFMHAADGTNPGAVSTSAQTIAGAKTFTSEVTLADQKELRLSEASGGGTDYVGIRAPAVMGAPYSLTLPAADGSANQSLVTNGSGTLSWASFMAYVAPSTSGNVLTSDGSNWVSSALPVATTASVGVMRVGTGLAVTTSGTVSGDFGAAAGKVTEGNDKRLNPAPIITDAYKVVRQNATGDGYEVITAAALMGSANVFVQDGNSFGGTATLGTNDGNQLRLETSGVARMTIDTTGNVGIGVTAPVKPLDVLGSIRSTSNFGGLDLLQANGTGFRWTLNNDGKLYFQDTTDTFTGIVHQLMTIDSATGNIGIGNINPSAALDVKGSIYVSGSTSGFVGFRAPAVAGSGVLTLPATVGASGQVMVTDGSGILSWASVGASGAAANSVLAIDGSAATPSIAFSADTNTGLFRPGTDTIAVSTSGVERMRVNDSGYVGIGTTNPGQALTIAADASGSTSNWMLSQLTIFGKTDSNQRLAIGYDTASDIAAIQAGKNGTGWKNIALNPTGGNIAIGTTTANALLDVGGLSTVAASGYSNYQAHFGASASGAGWGGVLLGFGTTGNSPFVGATKDGSGNPLPLVFKTNAEEQVRINPSGFVGVGVTNPQTRLHMAGDLRLDGSTSGYVGLRAPAVAGSGVLTLPATVGTSGQTLVTDGSGVLSWVSASGSGSGFPVALGSSGSPSMNFSGDSNTGIYSPGADTIAISTSGLERMRIDASGNMGIGTTAPVPQSKLTATGSISANGPDGDFAQGGNRAFMDFAGGVARYGAAVGGGSATQTAFWSNNSEVMRLNASGNVGIGTTSPNAKLSFGGSGGLNTFHIYDSGGAGAHGLGVTANTLNIYADATATTSATIAFGKSDKTTFTEWMRVINGNVGIGTTSPNQKFVVTGASGAAGGAGTSGILSLTTGTGANTDNKIEMGVVDATYAWINAIRPGTSTLPLMLNPSGGNVGVGTTSASAKLHVGGDLRLDGSTSGYVVFKAAPVSGSSTYIFPATDGSANAVLTTDGSGNLTWAAASGSGSGFPVALGSSSAPSMSFTGDLNTGLYSPAADNVAITTSGVEALRVNASGYVGIGTTTPTSHIHVAKDQNAATQINVANPNTGASAMARMIVSADVSSAFLTVFSSAYSGITEFQGDAVLYTSATSQDLGLASRSPTGVLKFYTGGEDAANRRMTIAASGNVGIGITTPTEKLDVSGAIKIGAASASGDGTIRWTGTDFEGRKGGSWVSMTGSGAGSTAPVSFSVNKNGSSQTVTNGVSTKVTWPNEVYDTNGNFASDRFTPTVAGKYFINAGVYCSDATSYCQVHIYKNGAAFASSFVITATSNADVNSLIDMNGTTDYLEVYVFNSGGTTASGITAYTHFSGFLTSSTTVSSSGSGTANYIPAWTSSSALGNSPMAVNGSNIGIGTTSAAAKLEVAGGDIRINGSTSGYVGLRAPAVAGSGILTLPATVGTSGQTLVTDGSGVLSWAAAGGSGSGFPVALGTSSAPSMSFTGDLNTGFYSPGADTVAVSTSGVERMRVDSSGNIGIGTTSPVINGNASTFLTVDGGTANFGEIAVGKNQSSATGYVGGIDFINSNIAAADKRIGVIWARTDGSTNSGAMMFHTFDTGNNLERMRISSTGNVGIGTTAPGSKLEVSGAIKAANYLGPQQTAFTIGTDINYSSGASIQMYGTTGSGGLLNSLVFNTGATTWGERMRIDATGNVGIGVTTPGSKLTVAGSIESTVGGFKFPDGTIQTTSAVSGSNNSMVTNFPDIIICTVDTHGPRPFHLTHAPYIGNSQYYYRPVAAETNYDLRFDASGNFAGIDNATTSDCNVSISALKAAGKAFNIIKGPAAQWMSGSGSSAYYNAGNVGIATSAPVDALDIRGNLKIGSTANSGILAFGDITSAANSSGAGLYIGRGIDSSSTLSLGGFGGMAFHVGDTPGSPSAPKMSINSSGYVGIGTTNPGAQLDVKDTIRLSGSTSGYVGLRAPAVAGSGVLTLPSTVGTSGQVMVTDGSGILSWAASGSGSGFPVALGSSSAPSMSFTGDLNTGIYSPGADIVAVATSGVERLRVNASGISVAGIVESTSGGFKFPDGTTQTTSAVSGSNNTMVSGFPDIILCTVDWYGGTSYSVDAPFVTTGVASNGLIYYTSFNAIGAGTAMVAFNPDGTYNSIYGNVNGSGSASWNFTNCKNQSISTIVAAGKSVNIAKGPAAQWIAGSSSSAYYNAGNVGIGINNPSAKLEVAGGDIRINGSTSGYVGLRAPAVAGSGILTLPATVGTSGQVMVTDGSGVMSWASPTSSSFPIALGTSASPSMNFSGDTDTGIYSPAADNVAISTSGTERLRINASGNVGIGLTTPASRFHVHGATGAATYIQVTNTDGGSTASDGIQIGIDANEDNVIRSDENKALRFITNTIEGITITSAGRVGIGYTNAQALFEVGTSSGISLSDSTFGRNFAIRSATLNDVTTAAAGSATNGTLASINAPTFSASNAGVTTANGYTFYIAGAPIKGTNNTVTNAVALGIGATAVGSQINSFGLLVNAQTGATNNYAAAFMGGNVGIGTSAPGANLDVKDTIRLSGSTSGYVGLKAAAAAGSTTYTLPSADGSANAVLVTNGAGTLSWSTSTSASSSTLGVGSSGSPSLTFSGDSDTGFYSAGANQIGVAASGVQLFTIGASGIVSPTTGGAAMSTAVGTSAAPTYGFAGDTGLGWYRPTTATLAAATSGSERMRIDASGYVGIGTTAPAAKLDVRSADSTDANNVTTGSQLAVQESSASHGVFVRTKSTAGISGLTYPNQIFSTGGNAGLELYTDGRLIFGTSNTERMRIDTSGNVGIGTATPSAPLHVKGLASGGETLRLSPLNTGNEGGQLTLMDGTGTGGWEIDNYGADGSETLRIFRDKGENNILNALVINTSGNVGIGTAAPGQMLTVAGMIESTTGGIKFPDGSIQTTAATGGGGSSGQSMISGWPDSIKCTMSNPAYGDTYLVLGQVAGGYYYYHWPLQTADVRVRFNSDGTFSGYQAGITTSNCNKSITQLNTDGQAFYNANGGGSAGSMSDGTAGAPGLYFSSDTNTGFYRPTTDTLAIATGGVESVRVNASGNVGVGTTNPGAALDVKDTIRLSGSTSGYVGLKAAAAAGSTTYTLPSADGSANQVLKTDGSGNLSWVANGSGAGDFMKDGSVAMTGQFKAIDGSQAAPGIAFSAATNTGFYRVSSSTVKLSIGNSDSIQFGGASNALLVHATSNPQVGGSSSAANPSFSWGADSDTGIFRAASNSLGISTSGVERMRVDASGYVGIGTTAPTAHLHLSSASGNVNNFIQAPSSAYAYSRYQSGSTFWDFAVNDAESSGALQFRPAGGSPSMVINHSGQVGIGTTTPHSLLQITGHNSGTNGLSFFASGAYDTAKSWGTRMYKSDVGGGIPLILETQSSTTWIESARFDHGGDNDHPSLRTAKGTQLAITSGNVGIGTTAPGQKLTVAGVVESTTGGFKFPDGTTQTTASTSGSGTTDFQTRLLLHMDGSNASTVMTDSSIYTLGGLAIVGNSQISTAQSKFGGASAYFDGSGDVVYVSDVDSLEPGSGDFTLDFWFRPVGTGTQTLVAKRANNSSYAPILIIYDGSTGTVGLYMSSTDSSWDLASNSSVGTGASTGSWHHVAIVRSGGTIYKFLNGVSGGTISHSGVLANNAANWYFGSDSNGFNYNGYLDEIRLTKGVARWTSAFSVPTSAASISTAYTAAGTGTANRVPAWTSSSELGDSPIVVSGSNISVGGTIESTTGGVKFPDSTTQTTAMGSSYYYGNTTTSSLTWSSTSWSDVTNIVTLTDIVTSNISRSGSTFTFSHTGVYRVDVNFNAYGNVAYFALRMRKTNGSASTLAQRTIYSGSNGSDGVPMVLSALISVTAGDTVDLEYVTKGGTPGAWAASNTIDGENMVTGEVRIERAK